MATNPDEIMLELTQEGAWDDSSLVEAWDEALQEYKKYHSITAAGADPEALMEAAESGGSGGSDSVKVQNADKMEDAPPPPAPGAKVVMETAAVVEAGGEEAAVEIQSKPEVEAPLLPPPPQEPVEPETPTPLPDPQLAVFPFAQQHPAGLAAGYAIGGNDDAMRNLMMSWYWAGYYTGLHEGQQKAQQQQY